MRQGCKDKLFTSLLLCQFWNQTPELTWLFPVVVVQLLPPPHPGLFYHLRNSHEVLPFVQWVWQLSIPWPYQNSCMATVGSSTNHTRSSSCLANVGNESGNNQSSPNSLGTYLTWIVTQVNWYQGYWNFENSSNYQPWLGQDENLLMPTDNHLVTL